MMTPAERALLTSLYHVAMAALSVWPGGRIGGALRGLVPVLCQELGMVCPLPSRAERRAAR